MQKVSIVSPSFNQQEFVARTLKSIRDQADVDLEHLIFDGGSTDGTVEILEKHAANFQQAKLSIGSDNGQADAINKGFRKATGEFVTWLNTDDYYPKTNVLATVVATFETTGADVVYGRGTFVAPDGSRIRDAFINEDPSQLKDKLVHSVGILQPATFFRRSLLDRVGLLDDNIKCAFDHEFWLRLIQADAQFYFVDKELARATFHSNAKSSAMRSRQLRESAEVVSKYYGFASAEWIVRAAECDVTTRNGIVDAADVASEHETNIEAVSLHFFRQYNQRKSALSALLQCPTTKDYEASRKMLARSGLIDTSKIVATTFDDNYFDQGLTLIASIHQHEPQDRFVLVYDLNLSDGNKARLAKLHNVFIVPYPFNSLPDYPDFLEPKNYGYKCAAIDDAKRFGAPGARVLWVDAGVVIQRSLDEVFSKIDEDEVFFVDHDDKPSWPFYNGTFTHPVAAERMSVTHDELLGEHLCSCLLGYKIQGRYAKLFDEAAAYCRDRKIVVWDKHPVAGTKLDGGGVAGPPDPARLRWWGRSRDRIYQTSAADLNAALGYLGHRQDQSIFSILAARYKAPVSSATRYCISDDRSSQASTRNWHANGVDPGLAVADKAPLAASKSVTYHHRGTYSSHNGLRQHEEGSELLVVLGNGPSLKGFDFSRFAPFDTMGMNAAYRFWDEIRQYPRYYICLDKVVGISHKTEIERLIRERAYNGIQIFILRQNLIELFDRSIQQSGCIIDFDKMRETTSVFDAMPITTGSHAALAGVFFGYRKLLMMGIDVNYVERVDGAEERGGTVLELTETPADNPNYFFSNYQVAGDKYNIPNPTPELHLDSWRAIANELASRKVQMWNGSSISRVDCFPHREFDDLESALKGHTATVADATLDRCNQKIFSSFMRRDNADVDETGVVAYLYSNERGRDHVMLDVGAHFGTSASYFDALGWTIHCFEPDPDNRKKLTSRFGNKSNISVDPRAVSDTVEKDVSFFTSEESTGISGLHAFRETHSLTAKVDVTTVRDIVADNDIEHIDFLKIDVEGFDFNVLKGIPWETIAPDVIEAEFEDAKTLKLGHSYKDVCDYLIEHGYTVYLSEWHPIIRYGIAHDWRQVVRYPAPLASPDAWGNILAFREDPGVNAIQEAFDNCIKFRSDGTLGIKSNGSVTVAEKARGTTVSLSSNGAARHIGSNQKSALRPTKAASMSPKANSRTTKPVYQPPKLPLYTRFALWAEAGHPWIFQAGQIAMWALRTMRRFLPATLLSVSVLGALTYVLLTSGLADYHPFALAALAAVSAVLISSGVAGYALHSFKRRFDAANLKHTHEKAALNAKVFDASRQAQSTQTLLSKHEARLEDIEKARTERAAIERAQGNVSQEQIASVNTRLELLEGALDDLRDRIPQLLQKYTSTSNQIHALTAQTSDADARLEGLKERVTSTLSELEKLSKQLTAVETDTKRKLQDVIERTSESESALEWMKQASNTHSEQIIRLGEKHRSGLDQLLVDHEHLSSAIAKHHTQLVTLEGQLGQLDLTALKSEFDQELAVARERMGKIEDITQQAETSANSALFETTQLRGLMSMRRRPPYVRFNRDIDNAIENKLLDIWSRKLSLDLHKSVPRYLADRVGVIEELLQGRLATTSEDAIIRTIVAMSVKRANLEVLEVGTLFGTGAAVMYDALRPHFESVHFTLLDPLDGYYSSGTADIMTGQPVTADVLRRNLRTIGMSEDEYTLIQSFSLEAEAIQRASERRYDVAILDGDHSYSGVKGDFENYAPLVRLGGFVIFDDYGSDDWPDIELFVDNEVAQVPWLGHVGNQGRTSVWRVTQPATDEAGDPRDTDHTNRHADQE